MDNMQRITQMVNPGVSGLNKIAEIVSTPMSALARMARTSPMDKLAQLSAPTTAMDRLYSMTKTAVTARSVSEGLQSVFGGSSGKSIGTNLFDEVLGHGWGNKVIKYMDNSGKVVSMKAKNLPSDQIESIVRGKILKMDRNGIGSFLAQHGISMDDYNAWHRAAKKAKFGGRFRNSKYVAPLKNKFIEGKTRYTYRPSGAAPDDFYHNGRRMQDYYDSVSANAAPAGEAAAQAAPVDEVGAFENWANAGRSTPNTRSGIEGITGWAKEHPWGAVGAGAGGMMLLNNANGRRGY